MPTRPALRLALRVLALCFIALLPIAFSAWVDPAHLLGAPAYSRAIARALADGHYVTDVVNYDDRAIERARAAIRTDSVDVLAIGSSRLQPLTSSVFPSQRFVNASVAGGRLDDFLGIYGLYDNPRLRPKRLILSLDPWSLTLPESGPLWRSVVASHDTLLTRLGIQRSFQRDRWGLELA